MQHVLVAYATGHRFHQLHVRDAVEVTRQVRVNHLRMPAFQQRFNPPDGVSSAAAWAVGVLLVLKVRLEDRFQNDQGRRLYHTISDRGDAKRPYFNTEPDLEVTDIQLKLRYRQRFYRDWLVLEIAPQITFPKDYDHAFNPGIITKFEFDFGYLKDRQAFQSVFAF